MITKEEIISRLNLNLGKPIDKICPNKFHSYSENHCAHFVSHIANLNFNYNCKSYKGGDFEGANVRVQEIFSECPKVGDFDTAPKDIPVLVFVTKDSNVNLANKKMGNIKQKHIGILYDGFIFHYSNTQEEVVKWTPSKFIDTFQRIYTGNQKLYYGLIPGYDLLLNVDASGNSIVDNISFDIKKINDKWFAKALNHDDNADFLVGKEVKQASKGYFGIYQPTSEYSGKVYKGDDFYTKIDHWAYLLEVIGFCESKNHFNVINTYDRAKFTYGFLQYAAHTPNDNLILLFKKFMEHPSAKKYFPELKLIDKNLFRVNKENSHTDLERPFRLSNGSTNLQYFMNYLNPLRKNIDEQEILHAARLIHWTRNDKLMREQQVFLGNEILQRKMSIYNRWYNLENQSDELCFIIADIHHQGRASKTNVKKALSSSDPIENLIHINSNYKNRAINLKTILDKLKNEGKIGNKSYSSIGNEFN